MRLRGINDEVSALDTPLENISLFFYPRKPLPGNSMLVIKEKCQMNAPLCCYAVVEES